MADNDNEIPAIPLPPAASGVPPVEPAPAAPPAPSAPSVPPAPPAAPGAPQPLPPVAPPQADPYAAPGATPNPYAQPGSAAPAYAPVAAGPAQGLSLAALITGIGAVLLSFVGFGFLPAVAAVILGHLGQRRQPYARPLWLTGLITGYVALGISLITGLFAVIALVVGFSSYNNY